MSIKLATVLLVSVAVFASSSSAKPAQRMYCVGYLGHSVSQVYKQNGVLCRGKCLPAAAAGKTPQTPPIWSCAGGHGLHPDPQDCGQFYQCSPGHRPFHLSCPAGLHFNPVGLVCNWPGSLATPCVSQLGQTVAIRCGIPAVRSSASTNRIVGGHEVVPGSQPWVVSFQHPLYPLPNFNLCGGALIAPNLVVTAANCFRPLSKPQTGWVAHLGEHNLYEDEGREQNITVQDIVVHENFAYDVLDNDIALVRLSQPAQMNDWVSPICLPEGGEKVEQDTLCTAVGWGYTKPLAFGEFATGDIQSPILQEIELPVVSNVKCSTKLPDYEIHPDQMCAGYEEGGIDTCVGDSGGPLACKDGSGRMTIQGITSFGDKGTCAQHDKPGVYSRVSAFVSWIREHVTDQEWAVIGSYV